jgi:hypothetical protein
MLLTFWEVQAIRQAMGLGLPDIHSLSFVDQHISEKMLKDGGLTLFRKWLHPNVIAPAEKKSDPNDNTSDDDGDVSILFFNRTVKKVTKQAYIGALGVYTLSACYTVIHSMEEAFIHCMDTIKYEDCIWNRCYPQNEDCIWNRCYPQKTVRIRIKIWYYCGA